MRLFSDGTIYFIDGRTEHIKYALVSENAILVTAGSGTYKICRAQRPNCKVLHDEPLYLASYKYSMFKWNDELHVWADYTNLDYVECRE